MDIARDICTDSFYIVNSGLPCIAVTAVLWKIAIICRRKWAGDLFWHWQAAIRCWL